MCVGIGGGGKRDRAVGRERAVITTGPTVIAVVTATAMYRSRSRAIHTG